MARGIGFRRHPTCRRRQRRWAPRVVSPQCSGALVIRAVPQLRVRREARVELKERCFLTTDFADDADAFLSVVSVVIRGLLFFAVARPAVAADGSEIGPEIFEFGS